MAYLTGMGVDIDCSSGLNFEAYFLPSTGGTLADWEDGVFHDNWNGMKSHLQHFSFGHTCDMKDKCIAWFNNGDSFIDLIPDFAEVDRYLMRWRGDFRADETGFYGFLTASNDGSRLYLNGELIVENDGDRSSRQVVTRQGSVFVQDGWHPLVIT